MHPIPHADLALDPLPLRIAAHNGAPEWGGAEIAVSRLLVGLHERGHQIRFFCGRSLVEEQAAAYGLSTTMLPVGGDAAVHHGLRVARALRAFRADVLVVGTFRKLLHLCVGARLARVPVVARIGLSTDLPRNAKYRWLFRHWVDRIVVNAEDVRAAYLAALPGLSPERIATIPKGFPTPPPRDREGARALFGLGPDDVAIGGLARLVEQKRLDRFVEVLAAAPPGVTGLLAGDGPLRDHLASAAAGAGGRVRLLGQLADPADFLAALDLLLITSDRESLANAMLEALAAGVPVVSTPVSGAMEALSPDEGEDPPGVVTEDFSVPALAEAVRKLVSDRELRLRMSRAAAVRAQARYQPGAMLDRWEEVLTRVALSRRSEPRPAH